MDRKQFLKVLGQGCACCGAMLAFGDVAAAAETPAPSECDNKFQFAQTWTMRMLNQLDSQLDAPTRTRIMNAMGRECFNSGGAKHTPKDVDELIAGFKKHQGEDAIRREGNVVYLKYTRSGAKLVSDGYCLCPLAEKTPAGWSATYCECSVGYVKSMFEQASGKPAKVDLLDSLKRDGRSCSFKVELQSKA